jgi:CheY-like chemotaxis protein
VCSSDLGELRLPEADVAEHLQGRLDVGDLLAAHGDDAITLAKEAATDGHPFDVVILDVRMPPGIDGVEAGSQIRELDPDVEIVFVTGFSDVPRDELERRVPPPMRLHYFNKPISFMKLAEDVVSIVKAH